LIDEVLKFAERRLYNTKAVNPAQNQNGSAGKPKRA
jgi:Ca2+ transporting ATPase